MIISVILVNFNSSSDLTEAVDSLEKSLIPKGFTRQVIIIENGSNDQEGEWSKLQPLTKYKDVELIKSPTNTGFTGGHNLGIERGIELDSSYFLLLNPDTKVHKNFLVELLKPFQATVKNNVGRPVDRRQVDRLGLASPKIYFYPGFEFHKDRYPEKDLGKVIWYAGGIVDWDNAVAGSDNVDVVDRGQLSKQVQETDFATGCCLLISKKVIEKIGLLDEKLFFSWEDTDYSIRAKKAGFEVAYVPGSVIWHKNAATSGGAGSTLQDYYQTRNRLIFAFRYAPWKVKILLLLQLLKTGNGNRLRATISAFWALIT